MSKRPNTLFIFADQHRHDALGSAGNALIETPTLDRLSESGVRFSEAWCQSPICQPSRAALITGRYPHELGVMRNFGPDMDDRWPTFMKQLQQAGYTTANIGKTHYYAEYLKSEGVYEAYRDQLKSIWRLTEHHWDGVTSPISKEQDLTSFLTREAQSWLARSLLKTSAAILCCPSSLNKQTDGTHCSVKSKSSREKPRHQPFVRYETIAID